MAVSVGERGRGALRGLDGEKRYFMDRGSLKEENYYFLFLIQREKRF